MQEVLIAVGILGVGLILVAAVFPVALARHRDSTDAAAAVSLGQGARALMAAKIDVSQLWRPATGGVLPPGEDGPWLLLPFANVTTGSSTVGFPGDWDSPPEVGTASATFYANEISRILGVPAVNRLWFAGQDVLSDGRFPIAGGGLSADEVAELSTSRLTWYGFYRERESGWIDYAVAVCRQTRGEQFVEQDLGQALPFAEPRIFPGLRRRLPVPWRFQVAYAPVAGDPATFRRIFNSAPADAVWLGSAARVGSRIMISGWVDNDGSAPKPVVPVGRILTVSRVLPDNHVIEVLEDISDLPDNAGAGSPTFDVWVFPPAFRGDEARGVFERESPLMEWFFS